MNIKKVETVALAPGLYLVATPIGNLRDITLRALDILSGADLVVCEDTRVTGKLLDAYGIKKKMLPYNDHNAARQRPKILEALGNNQSIAFTSDAGMPLVSDPGYKLVRDCLDLGLSVTTVPGASAPLAALQLSGLPSDRFVFLGFPPAKKEARKAFFRSWVPVNATLVFFETAPRLVESLKDAASVLGDRSAAVVREITKRFEESRRGQLSTLAAVFQDNDPKGEIVVVVEGCKDAGVDETELRRQLTAALKEMSVRDAAAFVAEATALPRREVYKLALSIAGEREE